MVFPRFIKGTNPQSILGFFRICGVYCRDDEKSSFKCNYVSTMYPAPRPFSRRIFLLPRKPLRRLMTIAIKSLCQSLSLDTVPAPWSWSSQGSITIIIKLSMFNLHKYYNKNFLKNQFLLRNPRLAVLLISLIRTFTLLISYYWAAFPHSEPWLEFFIWHFKNWFINLFHLKSLSLSINIITNFL